MTFASRVLQAVWAGASRAAAWPFRVAAARATLRALGQMDCRELADIGLTRCDLRDAFALPLDRDPGELLAVRVRDRQVNALAAPPTAWDVDSTGEDPRCEPRRNHHRRGRVPDRRKPSSEQAELRAGVAVADD
jgi:uncharacterized protein YjiS (DUF1127 family)